VSDKPWSGVIGPEDERRYELAGFGGPSGMGERPALLVIDVQYRTLGDSPKPFEEAVKDYPTAGGAVAWAALANIERLVATFRELDLSILYPHVAPKLDFDRGALSDKVPSIFTVAEHGYEMPESIAPRPQDVLLPKRHPSAFFGTPLASYLIERRADTLVVTGTSTSGCIRASVVDGFAYNFRAVVPHDAVWDRTETVHKVNLFDMAQKYADVTSTEELDAALRERHAG
jgi:maleamate amidohydrolase